MITTTKKERKKERKRERERERERECTHTNCKLKLIPQPENFRAVLIKMGNHVTGDQVKPNKPECFDNYNMCVCVCVCVCECVVMCGARANNGVCVCVWVCG